MVATRCLRSELGVGRRGAGAQLGQQCRFELLVAHLGRNQLDLTPPPVVHDRGLARGRGRRGVGLGVRLGVGIG